MTGRGWSNLDMITVHTSSSAPQFLDQLREWVELEWGEVDPFEGNHALHAVPAPLVAVDDSDLLVGGIAFTRSLRPDSSELGVWINALLVDPDFRGRGIASELVRAAELEAHRQGVLELLVYTNVPSLYLKLGWSLLKRDNENSVLIKIVGEQQV